MVPYWLLVLHLTGDYLLQSDWMAQKKTTSSVPAMAHAIVYTAPFWLLMPSWWAMLLVGGTHFAIDRWRLARYVCWLKNFLAPRWIETGERVLLGDGRNLEMVPEELRNYPWADCSATGYHKDRPVWLSVWLLIIADNTLHLAFNGLAWTLYSSGHL